MTIEQQILDELREMNMRLGGISEWVAGTKVLCKQHADEIKHLSQAVDGNGKPGICDRVLILEEQSKTTSKWNDMGKAVLTSVLSSGLVATIGFLLYLYARKN